MVGDRFSSSTSCSGWLHETAPARPDPSLSCLFLKVATHPSWIPSSSRAARPPGMRPLAATVRRRPAGGCGPAPASASSLPAYTRSRARGVLVFGGVGLPRRCVCHDRGPVRIGGPCVSRGAQAGGVRPLPPPATRRCRGAVRLYAVPRRTRRRGDAVRGAAGPTGWDRRRAGTACACCARYSTSWSPASSNSCS